MKRHKLLILLLAVTLTIGLIFGFAHNRIQKGIQKDSDLPVIFSDERVTVCDVSNKPSPFTNVDHEWALLEENEVFDERYSVLEGVITDFSDVDVVYQSSNGEEVHSYETIMTLLVTQVIHDDTGITTGKSVSVGIPYNSWTCDEELPRVSKDMTVVVFCYKCEDFKDDLENDWIQHYKYVDYWVYAPFELFLQKIDDSFLVYKPSYFSQKAGIPLPSMIEPAATDEDYDEWFEERMAEFEGTKYEAILRALSDKKGRITWYILEMCQTVQEADLLLTIENGFSGGLE